jgi:histidinol-phosphate aminotransferase
MSGRYRSRNGQESGMGYFRDNVERMEGYTPGFQPKATDVVKLNTNENPYPPSPDVMKALAQIDPERLRRYPDPLGGAFREAAARLHNVRPDNILCCNGGDELLALAVRAFCDESRPLAYPVPTYTLYPVLARLQNCPTIEIPFGEEGSLPEELAKTDAPLTILCNPNAPTATMVPTEQIAELVKALKGVLLIDEAYVDFAEYDCIDIVRQLDNVIILRTLSKGYSLAGLRFGYAVASKGLIDGLMKGKDSYNVDAISIALATAAIEDQAYFKANVEKIKKDRQVLIEQLRLLGFAVSDSRTNFLLADTNTDTAAEIHEQLTRRDIYVRYFNVPGLADKLRITVGTAQQNEKLLAALRDILSQL